MKDNHQLVLVFMIQRVPAVQQNQQIRPPLQRVVPVVQAAVPHQTQVLLLSLVVKDKFCR